MGRRYQHRTALLTCALSLCLGTAACSKHKVDVAFSIPAKHALPHVASVAIGSFSGVASEDVADLLYDSLERADHFAVFRQQPNAHCPVPDNFAVAIDHASHACVEHEADAVLHGVVRQRPPQISYSVCAQRTLPPLANTSSVVTYETRVCRRQQQDLSVILKVSLRQGRRDHLCIDAQQSYTPSEECIYVPGRVSLSEAPFYFVPLGQPPIHVPSLMRAIDGLAADLVPRRTTEPMVIYYDRRIPLSEKALAAASDGNWDLAAALYEQAIEDTINSHISLTARGRLHYNCAIALAGQGDFARALRHMEIAEVAETSDVYIAARIRLEHYQQQAQRAASERDDLVVLRQTLSCTLRASD